MNIEQLSEEVRQLKELVNVLIERTTTKARAKDAEYAGKNGLGKEIIGALLPQLKELFVTKAELFEQLNKYFGAGDRNIARSNMRILRFWGAVNRYLFGWAKDVRKEYRAGLVKTAAHGLIGWTVLHILHFFEVINAGALVIIGG